MKALDVILQQAEWYFKMKEDQALRAAMSIAQIAVTDGVSPDTRLRLEHHFAVLSGFMQPCRRPMPPRNDPRRLSSPH